MATLAVAVAQAIKPAGLGLITQTLIDICELAYGQHPSAEDESL